MSRTQRNFILRLIDALFYDPPRHRASKRAATQKHRKSDKLSGTAKRKPKEPKP
jgi:hypothetical protein